MDDNIYVLYVDIDKIDLDMAKELFESAQKFFPEKNLIMLPTYMHLEKVDRATAINNLQKMIETLSQE